MKTHTDVKIWLTGDAEIEVSTSGTVAWADINPGNVTIHGLSIDGGSDLDALENFFRKGLDAVLRVKHPRLFELVPNG